MSGVLEALSGPLKKYVTRILQSYLGKYIKNIQLEGLGLMDDIVLYNLELRLDVLQELIPAPLSFTFTRGFVGELRVIIPWTALFSSPIQVKLTRLECILTAKSKQSFAATAEGAAHHATPALDKQAGKRAPDTPVADDPMGGVPKWLQSRLLAIVANVSVTLSNLVLKYQHADVMCWVGVDAMRYVSASLVDWEPGFQTLDGPRKMIGKVCDIKGLTITLDRKRTNELPILSPTHIEVRAQLCLDPTGPLDSHTKQPGREGLPVKPVPASESSSGPNSGPSGGKHAGNPLSIMSPLQAGGAGASSDVNSAFGSLMLRGAAMALVDVHVSALEFNLSTHQCEMIRALTSLPDAATEDTPLTPQTAVPDVAPVAPAASGAIAAVDSPVAVEGKAGPAPQQQGWASWVWGMVAGPDESDSPDGDDDAIPSPVSTPKDVKHDTITIINAHLKGVTFTLHRRVLVSKRRRGSVGLDELASSLKHNSPVPFGPGTARRDSRSIGRAESPHSETSSMPTTDVGGVSDPARHVIQVPVANVGFVAVPVTPAHSSGPVTKMQSVPLVTLALEACDAQIRIHDSYNGQELTAAGKGAPGAGRMPVQVMDVFVDIGRLSVDAAAPCDRSVSEVESPMYRLVALGDHSSGTPVTNPSGPKCVYHPHSYCCLFDPISADGSVLAGEWWQGPSMSSAGTTLSGNGVFDVAKAPHPSTSHAPPPLAAQCRLSIVKPNPTESTQRRIEVLSGVGAVLRPRRGVEPASDSGTDTETEGEGKKGEGPPTSDAHTYTILRGNVGALGVRYEPWVIQQVMGMLSSAFPHSVVEVDGEEAEEQQHGQAAEYPAVGLKDRPAPQKPSFDVAVDVGSVQVWLPISSPVMDGPPSHSLDPRAVDAWLLAEVKHITARYQKGIPFTVATAVVLPTPSVLSPGMAFGDKRFTSGIDDLSNTGGDASLLMAAGVSIDVGSVGLGVHVGLPSHILGRRVHNIELLGLWSCWSVRTVHSPDGNLPHSSHHAAGMMEVSSTKSLPPLMPSCSLDGHVTFQAGVSRVIVDVSPQLVTDACSAVLAAASPWVGPSNMPSTGISPQSCRQDSCIRMQLDGLCIGASCGKTAKQRYGDGGFSLDGRLERVQVESCPSKLSSSSDMRGIVCLCWPSVRTARGVDPPLALVLCGRGTILPASVTGTLCHILSAGLWFGPPKRRLSRHRFGLGGFRRRFSTSVRAASLDTGLSSEGITVSSAPSAALLLETAPADVDWGACVSLTQTGFGLGEVVMSQFTRVSTVDSAAGPMATRRQSLTATPSLPATSLQADISSWLWSLQAVTASDDSTPRSAVSVLVHVHPWVVACVCLDGTQVIARTPTIQLKTQSATMGASSESFRLQSGVVLDAVVDGLIVEATPDGFHSAARATHALTPVIDVGVNGRIVWKCQFTSPPSRASEPALSPTNEDTLFWVGFQSSLTVNPLNVDVSVSLLRSMCGVPLPSLAPDSVLRIPARPRVATSRLDDFVPSIDEVLGACTLHVTYDVSLRVPQVEVTFRSLTTGKGVKHYLHGSLGGCDVSVVGSSAPFPSLDVNCGLSSVTVRSVEHVMENHRVLRESVVPILSSVQLKHLAGDGTSPVRVALSAGISSSDAGLGITATCLPVDVLVDVAVVQWVLNSVLPLLPHADKPPHSPRSMQTLSGRIPDIPKLDVRLEGFRVLLPSSERQVDDEPESVDGLGCGGYLVLFVGELLCNSEKSGVEDTLTCAVNGISLNMCTLSRQYRPDDDNPVSRPLFRGDAQLSRSPLVLPMDWTAKVNVSKSNATAVRVSASVSVSGLEVVATPSNIAEVTSCVLLMTSVSPVRQPDHAPQPQRHALVLPLATSIHPPPVDATTETVIILCEACLSVPLLRVALSVGGRQSNPSLELCLTGLDARCGYSSKPVVELEGSGLSVTLAIQSFGVSGCTDVICTARAPILSCVSPSHPAMSLTLMERPSRPLSPHTVSHPLDVTLELADIVVVADIACVDNTMSVVASVLESVSERLQQRKALHTSQERSPIINGRSDSRFPSKSAHVWRLSCKLVTSPVWVLGGTLSVKTSHSDAAGVGFDQLFASVNFVYPSSRQLDDGSDADDDLASVGTVDISLAGLACFLSSSTPIFWRSLNADGASAVMQVPSPRWGDACTVLSPVHIRCTAEISSMSNVPSAFTLDVNAVHVSARGSHVLTGMGLWKCSQAALVSSASRLSKCIASLSEPPDPVSAVSVQVEPPEVRVGDSQLCLTALKLRRSVGRDVRPSVGELVCADAAVWNGLSNRWEASVSWRCTQWLALCDVRSDEPVLLPVNAFDDHGIASSGGSVSRTSPKSLACVLQRWDECVTAYVDVFSVDVMVQAWGGTGTFGGPREERVHAPFVRGFKRLSGHTPLPSSEWRLLWCYPAFSNTSPGAGDVFRHNTHISVATSLLSILRFGLTTCDALIPAVTGRVSVSDVRLSVRHDCNTLLYGAVSIDPWREDEMVTVSLPLSTGGLALWRGTQARCPPLWQIPSLHCALTMGCSILVVDPISCSYLPVVDVDRATVSIQQSPVKSVIEATVGAVAVHATDVAVLIGHHLFNAIRAAVGQWGKRVAFPPLPPQPLSCMRLVVRNQTGVDLFYGQFGTPECVFLPSNISVAYGWSDPDAVVLGLRFALAVSPTQAGAWSSHVKLDVSGTVKLSVRFPGDTAAVVWASVKLAGLSSEVCVYGSLCFGNHLPIPLRCRWWVASPAPRHVTFAGAPSNPVPASESSGAFLSMDNSTGKLRFSLPFQGGSTVATHVSEPSFGMPADAGHSFLSSAVDVMSGVDVESMSATGGVEAPSSVLSTPSVCEEAILEPLALPAAGEDIDGTTYTTLQAQSGVVPQSKCYLQFRRDDEEHAWSAVVPVELDHLVDDDVTNVDPRVFLVRVPSSLSAAGVPHSRRGGQVDMWCWCVVRRAEIETPGHTAVGWTTVTLFPIVAIDNRCSLPVELTLKRADAAPAPFVDPDDVLWKFSRQFKVAEEERLLQQREAVDDVGADEVLSAPNAGGQLRYWEWGADALVQPHSVVLTPFLDPLAPYTIAVSQAAPAHVREHVAEVAAAAVPSHAQLKALSSQATLLACPDVPHQSPALPSDEPTGSNEPLSARLLTSPALDPQKLAEIAVASASAGIASFRAGVRSPPGMPPATPSSVLVVDESLSVLPALHLTLDTLSWLRLHGDKHLSQQRLSVEEVDTGLRSHTGRPVSRIPTAAHLTEASMADLCSDRRYLLPFAPRSSGSPPFALLAHLSRWSPACPTLRLQIDPPFIFRNVTELNLILRFVVESVHTGSSPDVSAAPTQECVTVSAGATVQVCLLGKRGSIVFSVAQVRGDSEITDARTDPTLTWSSPHTLKMLSNDVVYVPDPSPQRSSRFVTPIVVQSVLSEASSAGQCTVTFASQFAFHNATALRMLVQPCYPCFSYSDVIPSPAFELDCTASSFNTVEESLSMATLPVPLPVDESASRPSPYTAFSVACVTPGSTQSSLLQWSDAIVVCGGGKERGWSPFPPNDGDVSSGPKKPEEPSWEMHKLVPSDTVYVFQAPLCLDVSTAAPKVLLAVSVKTVGHTVHITVFQDTQPPVRIVNRSRMKLGLKLLSDSGVGRALSPAGSMYTVVPPSVALDFDWRFMSREPLSTFPSPITPKMSPSHQPGVLTVQPAKPLARLKPERVFPKDTLVVCPHLQLCVLPDVRTSVTSTRPHRCSGYSDSDADTRSVSSSFGPSLVLPVDDLPLPPVQLDTDTAVLTWSMPAFILPGQHFMRLKRVGAQRRNLFPTTSTMDAAEIVPLCVSMEVQGNTTQLVLDDITDVSPTPNVEGSHVFDFSLSINSLRASLYSTPLSQMRQDELLSVEMQSAKAYVTTAPSMPLAFAAGKALEGRVEPVTQALSVETVIGADGGVASAKQNTPAPAPSLKGLPLSVTHSAMFGGVTLADITIYGPVSDTGDAGKQLTPILSINSPGSGPAVSLSCVLTTPVKVGVSSLCCATVPSFLKEIDALLAPITVNCEDNQIIDAIHAVTRLVTSTVAQHAVMCSRHDDRSGVHEPSLSQKSVLEELRVGRSVGRVRATASSTIPATVWRVLSAGSLGDLPDSLLSSLSPLFVLGSLHLSEICLVLTLHATRPVFIGVDNMTFTMSPVVLSHVCASGSHLLRELLAQLIADAVLSSPSLVGSLEVLGNPTGLLRSFGAGVYDLFALPLASLDKGRGGVVKGVAAGWKSLFTHVSEAALHSVSGIAGTLSRNLDRVSYDEAQVREREAARRRHAGLSASVAAGFRVLSSDVLSAAVGVVSDPFKVAAASGWGVTSFVKGMGRGLLGAVTKPVSGALDLVSQTSTGILNSSGLNTSPERRRASRTLTSHVNAQLLLRWRLLPPEFVYIGHFEGDIMVTEPLHDMFGCLFTCTIVMTTTALLILPPTKVGTPRRHPAVHSRVPLPQLLGSRVPGVPLTDIVSVEDGQTVRELLTLRCVRDGSHEYSVKFMIDGGEKRALCAQLRAATTLKPFP